MEDNTVDIDAEILEKLIYKHLSPALRARAGRDADGNPIDALDQPDTAPPPEPVAEHHLEPPANPVPNRGGAPIGNQNARKHVLYTGGFTPAQQEALPYAGEAYSLIEEIAALRLRVAALMEDPEPDHKLILRYMSVLSHMVRIDDRVRFGP